MDNGYQNQVCEASDCQDEVFSSCHRCNILLCYNHFIGDDGSCHAHNVGLQHANKFQVSENEEDGFGSNGKNLL